MSDQGPESVEGPEKASASPDMIDRAVEQWSQLGFADEAKVMAVGLRLNAVHAAASKQLDREHRAAGLAPGDFDVLATVFRSGDVPISPTDLAHQLLSSKSGVSGRLDRLAKQGLLERQPNPSDRRGTRILLTRRGQLLMERLVPRHVAMERAWMNALSPDELELFHDLLAKIMKTGPRA